MKREKRRKGFKAWGDGLINIFPPEIPLQAKIANFAENTNMKTVNPDIHNQIILKKNIKNYFSQFDKMSKIMKKKC